MKLPLRFSIVVCVLAIVLGCAAGKKDTQSPGTGDPEADRRADLRVGSDADQSGAKPGATLYDRLGGAPKIKEIVDDVTTRILADPRVNFERRNVSSDWFGSKYKAWSPTTDNIDQFKKRMVEFLSLAAGGPAEYSGRDMRATHKGMRITNTEFDAVVGDFKTTLDKLKIGANEKRDLLAIIETTRKEIVEK